MWGVLAKIGGAVLATLGIDAAVESYNSYNAQKEQEAQNQKIGKIILGGVVLFVAYKMFKKMK